MLIQEPPKVYFMKKTRRITAIILAAITIFISLIAPVGAASVYKLGDISRDGDIAADDARLALRYSVNLEYYTKAHLKIGDVNSDSKITAMDARIILRASVKLEEIPSKKISVTDSELKTYVNKPEDDMFSWDVPDMPVVKAPSGTFTFTYYGYGHGVGLSQYGAIALEDKGMNYEEMVTHYFTGTEVKKASNIPSTTYYPTTGYINTEQLVAKIVYQEIYGITDGGKYKESLKAMALCVFTLLMREGFYVTNRWDVGIATSISYTYLPSSLKNAVHSVFGEYITVKGQNSPIMSVYSAVAVGKSAASRHVWGGNLSYLQAVESPVNIPESTYIFTKQYTVSQMRAKIKAYDSSIVLSSNPADWLQILEHTGSIDENRGYVTKIRVGNRELSGYNQFHYDLMGASYYSSCFIITYTP